MMIEPHRSRLLAIPLLLVAVACGSSTERKAGVTGNTVPPAREPQANTGNRLVSYDLRTGAQITYNLSFASSQASTVQIATDQPLQENSPVPLNFQPLARVLDTTDPSFSAHGTVFLSVELPDGRSVIDGCSGTMISPQQMLTAGHCVYTDLRPLEGRTWVSDVVVAPGSAPGVAPFGTANGIMIHAFTGFIENNTTTDDMAIVTLDRPVGLLSGWRTIGSNPDCAFWKGATWTTVGYPYDSQNTDVYDGSKMFRRSGSFDDCTKLPFTVSSNSPAFHGMSGSGAMKVITLDSGSYLGLWGVVVAGDTNLEIVSRFDSFKYHATQFAFDSTTPQQPDLVVLNVTSPRHGVRPDEPLEGLSYLVGNIGKQPFSGSVVVQLIRSPDDHIDVPGDTIVETHTETIDLKRNETTRLTFPSVVIAGSGVAPGAYHFGIRLVVGDANDTNDTTQGWDTARIRVLHRFEFPIDDLLNGLRVRP